MDCLPMFIVLISGSGGEDKYDWGAGVRGCEVADYPCEASMCEGQKLEGLKPP